MTFGFECDDGWFDLIWNLSQAIEESARRSCIEPTFDSWPEVIQVKQKFGSLRMHLLHHTDEISTLISSATEASRSICEKCGTSNAQLVTLNC